MAEHTKTVSLRIDEDLWALCKALAKHRHQSFNEFVSASLAQATAAHRQDELRDAFAHLAEQAPDVEFALEAQAEVALDDPRSAGS